MDRASELTCPMLVRSGGAEEGAVMAGAIRRRHEAVDFAAIERMFPPPPEYFETAWFDPPDVI